VPNPTNEETHGNHPQRPAIICSNHKDFEPFLISNPLGGLGLRAVSAVRARRSPMPALQECDASTRDPLHPVAHSQWGPGEGDVLGRCPCLRKAMESSCRSEGGWGNLHTALQPTYGMRPLGIV